MKKRLNPPRCLLEAWKKNFRYEQSKFINSTYLREDDLFSQFIDSDENVWIICGQMENGDIVCKNEKSGQYFTWDKWKVSQLRHPEKHIADKIPGKKLKKLIRKENKEKEYVQLSLCFDDEPKESIIEENDDSDEIPLEDIGSVDLDEIDVEFEDEEVEQDKNFDEDDIEEDEENE